MFIVKTSVCENVIRTVTVDPLKIGVKIKKNPSISGNWNCTSFANIDISSCGKRYKRGKRRGGGKRFSFIKLKGKNTKVKPITTRKNVSTISAKDKRKDSKLTLEILASQISLKKAQITLLKKQINLDIKNCDPSEPREEETFWPKKVSQSGSCTEKDQLLILPVTYPGKEIPSISLTTDDSTCRNSETLKKIADIDNVNITTHTQRKSDTDRDKDNLVVVEKISRPPDNKSQLEIVQEKNNSSPKVTNSNLLGDLLSRPVRNQYLDLDINKCTKIARVKPNSKSVGILTQAKIKINNSSQPHPIPIDFSVNKNNLTSSSNLSRINNIDPKYSFPYTCNNYSQYNYNSILRQSEKTSSSTCTILNQLLSTVAPVQTHPLNLHKNIQQPDCSKTSSSSKSTTSTSTTSNIQRKNQTQTPAIKLHDFQFLIGILLKSPKRTVPNLIPSRLINRFQTKMYGTMGEESGTATTENTEKKRQAEDDPGSVNDEESKIKRLKVNNVDGDVVAGGTGTNEEEGYDEELLGVGDEEDEELVQESSGDASDLIIDEKSFETEESNSISDLSNISHVRSTIPAMKLPQDQDKDGKYNNNKGEDGEINKDKDSENKNDVDENEKDTSGLRNGDPSEADDESSMAIENTSAPPSLSEEPDEKLENEILLVEEEVRTLRALIRTKELEWNSLLELQKLKEIYLEKLQRGKEVMNIEDSILQQDDLENMNVLTDKTCSLKDKIGSDNESRIYNNIEKTDREIMLQKNQIKQLTKKQLSNNNTRMNNACEFNASLALQQLSERNRSSHASIGSNSSLLKSLANNKVIGEGRQGPIVEVRSIIADYRSKNPALERAKVRNIKPAVNSQTSTMHQQNMSYKDVLVSLAKISQQDSSTNTLSTPTTSVSSSPAVITANKRSLLNSSVNSSPVTAKSSPVGTTLAKLLSSSTTSNNVQPNVVRQQHHQQQEDISGNINSNNKVSSNTIVKSENSISLANLLASAKSRDRDSNISSIRNQDHPAEEEIPICQGCNSNRAQFVCAGCSSQWYCSRECQITAWDEHSEICSG